MGASLGASKRPKPLLSFRAVLNAQLDDTLPYASLKRLLRALKTSSAISSYPTRTSQQPLLTLSLTQPSQPLPSASETQSQLLQRSIDRTASQHTPSEKPSRLRRKRRSSHRPPLALSNHVQRELFFTPSPSPTLSQQSPRQSHDASRVRAAALMDVRETALAINRHLNDLIHICTPHGVVTWPQLRKVLMDSNNQTYASFCNYIDGAAIFDPDEPLATGRLGSPSIKSCVYYSNLFWEQALRDFQASISSQ